MYPNPVKSGTNLQLRNIPPGAHVQLINSTGSILFTKDSWNSNQDIPTSNLTPGVYLLKVKLKTKINTYKVMVL